MVTEVFNELDRFVCLLPIEDILPASDPVRQDLIYRLDVLSRGNLPASDRVVIFKNIIVGIDRRGRRIHKRSVLSP